jgi:hypothetical protein
MKYIENIQVLNTLVLFKNAGALIAGKSSQNRLEYAQEEEFIGISDV